jgi:hypothetical protein
MVNIVGRGHTNATGSQRKIVSVFEGNGAPALIEE